jgi:hypothetical protein
MRVAVINFQRARHDAFLPQRDHQHRDFRRSVGFIIVFNNDFTVVNRLSSGWSGLWCHRCRDSCAPDANVGQHVVNIGGDDVRRGCRGE